jgi:hypothetical protein
MPSRLKGQGTCCKNETDGNYVLEFCTAIAILRGPEIRYRSSFDLNPIKKTPTRARTQKNQWESIISIQGCKSFSVLDRHEANKAV